MNPDQQLCRMITHPLVLSQDWQKQRTGLHLSGSAARHLGETGPENSFSVCFETKTLSGHLANGHRHQHYVNWNQYVFSP